jgi:hypothetical protein
MMSAFRRYWNAAAWSLLGIQAVLIFIVFNPWLTSDSDAYLRLARGLSQGFYGSASPTGIEPDVLRPPGYPLILSAIIGRFGASIGAVVALQLLLYLVAIFLISKYLIEDGALRKAFLALCCLYPFGAVYSAFVMTEAWCILIISGLAIAITRAPITPTKSIVAGSLCGAATMLRTDFLLLPVFLALFIYFQNRSREALASAAAVILAFAITVSPYIAWNHKYFGSYLPAPPAAATGNSLYLATWQGKLPLADLNELYAARATPRSIQSGILTEIGSANESFGAPLTTAPFNPAMFSTARQQIASSSVYRELAIKRILHDPGSYVQHVVHNTWALWNFSEDNKSVPRIVNLALRTISWFVFVFAIFGVASLFLGPREGRNKYLPIIVLCIYPMLVHLPLHTEARYTASVRLLLVLFCSIGLVRVNFLVRARLKPKALHH